LVAERSCVGVVIDVVIEKSNVFDEPFASKRKVAGDDEKSKAGSDHAESCKYLKDYVMARSAGPWGNRAVHIIEWAASLRHACTVFYVSGGAAVF
jgi:hypothetical protein